MKNLIIGLLAITTFAIGSCSTSQYQRADRYPARNGRTIIVSDNHYGGSGYYSAPYYRQAPVRVYQTPRNRVVSVIPQSRYRSNWKIDNRNRNYRRN